MDKEEEKMRNEIENWNCDGAGPHTPGEVKRYPTGGDSTAVLCFACWARENQYNYERREKQHNWYQAKGVNWD